jgi:hypothetical protein
MSGTVATIEIASRILSSASGRPRSSSWSTRTGRFFADTPILFCGSTEEQADNSKLDSNFTNAWMMVEPANTLEAALKFQLGAKARRCSRWCNVAAMVRERPCKLERRSSGGRSRRRGRANSGGDTGRLLRPRLVRSGNRPRRPAGRRDARARVTAARSIRDRKRARTRQTVRAVLPIPHKYAWSSADGEAVRQLKIAKEPARSKIRRAGSDG